MIDLLRSPADLDRLRLVVSDAFLPAPTNPRAQSSREQEIELTYARLRQLAHEAEHDAEAEDKYQRLMRKLRRLQRAEAQEIAEMMDAQLALRPGQGYAALNEAKELLARYAHPAPADDPADPADP